MRLSSPRSENGFTVIELLIVVLIIGVLATIALPAFLGQTGKANDAGAKSILGNAQIAVETAFHETNTYATTVAALQGDEPALATGAGSTMQYASSATGYEIRVRSASGTEFTLVQEGLIIDRSCNRPGHGGCPASGRW
jgi:prepilin-type N-terminal cleavage/methylation domain-containing protein